MKKNFLLFSILLITCFLKAADELKVTSFNVDTNIGRLEEGPFYDSHPKWRVNERMELLKRHLGRIIKNDTPDAINLQESRAFKTKFGTTVDSISPLVRFLKTNGYSVFTKPYNPSDRAFSYITALKKDKFTVDGHEHFYITETPNKPTDHTNHAERKEEIKRHNFGEEWERCIFTTKFHDKQGRSYRLSNVNLGIAAFGRKKACEMLRQDAQKALEKNPHELIVITGDFNSFPDWGGPEQLKIMKEGGTLHEVTEDLTLEDGTPADSTFIAFPYDFGIAEKDIRTEFEEQNGGKFLTKHLEELDPTKRKRFTGEVFSQKASALGGHLDRVYEHGFTSAKSELILTPTYEDDFEGTPFEEDSIKDYIMRHYDEGPAFASDHQIVQTTLGLPKIK
jgi:hypothetical protein